MDKSLKMMWVGMLVMATASLAAAQEGTTCECYAYFVCQNRTWHKEVECQYHNEVCCELDPITTATAAPTTASTDNPSIPNPLTSDSVVCGKRNKPSTGFTWKIDPAPGVEDGTEFGEFPWMAAIIRKTPKGQTFLCGASIVYPNLILTAAHTIKDIPASELMVKTGVWNTTDLSELPKHQDRTVLQTVLHPGFDKVKVANDFALLVLNEPITITENVAPVCLPSNSMPINESSCIATGWGADKYGKSNGDILKKVVLPLIDFNTCQSQMKASRLGSSFQLHDSFICAGDGHQGDTCVGDGGGPLMCATTTDPDKFVQVGITSWGVGCSGGVPGAYSSVRVAANWLEEQAEIFPPIYEKKSI